MRGLRFMFAIVATLGVVVAAGCGSGSSTSTSESAARRAADFHLARALIPVNADFPSGWTLEQYRVRASEAGAGCQIDQTGLAQGAHVRAIYQHGDHPAVVGAATVYRTRAQAMTAYQRAIHAGIRCMATSFERSARSSQNAQRHVIDFRLTPFTFPRLGDQSAAFHMALRWKIYGRRMSNQLDLVYFRVDRSVAALVGLNENAPFDRQLLIDLTTTVAQRGRAAA